MDKDEGHWQLRDGAGNGMRRKVGKNQTNKRPNNVERTSGRQFFMMSGNESLLFIFSWKKMVCQECLGREWGFRKQLDFMIRSRLYGELSQMWIRQKPIFSKSE